MGKLDMSEIWTGEQWGQTIAAALLSRVWGGAKKFLPHRGPKLLEKR